MPVITCIEDLRTLYKRRVPKMFYDCTESGSWSESTFRANVHDFEALRLHQRVAVNMENRSIAGEMVGEQVTMPVSTRTRWSDRDAVGGW